MSFHLINVASEQFFILPKSVHRFSHSSYNHQILEVIVLLRITDLDDVTMPTVAR